VLTSYVIKQQSVTLISESFVVSFVINSLSITYVVCDWSLSTEEGHKQSPLHMLCMIEVSARKKVINSLSITYVVYDWSLSTEGVYVLCCLL